MPLPHTIPVTLNCAVVIDAASSYFPEAAAACIAGLAQRKKATGKEVHFIRVCTRFTPPAYPHLRQDLQTSGTSSVVDDAQGSFASKYIYSDADDLHHKVITAKPVEGIRVGDSATTAAGLKHGVPTYVIIPAFICASGFSSAGPS